MARHWLATALIASVSGVFPVAAHAVVVSVTQAKVNQGGVTPGDTPGFPVTISRPGSYRLDTNLDFPSAAADKNGIEIRTNDVTIDFNGFRLQGWRIGNVGVAGNGYDTVRITNGVVGGFKSAGIWSRLGEYWTVEDMSVLVNGHQGVNLGASGRVQRNTVARNGLSGVLCLSCLVEGNVVSNNGDAGIALTQGSVLGNTIIHNKKFGISGSFGGTVGYGNNTLFGNNGDGPQVHGVHGLEPNHCSPACP